METFITKFVILKVNCFKFNINRGLLTGKLKRDDKDFAKTLAGTRLGWTNEKPDERTWPATPYIGEYRENEEYWTVVNALDAVAKEHGSI